MSNLFNNTTPTPGANNYIRVLIDDVDPVNQVAHAFDKTGVRIQALYTDQSGGVTLVPSAREVWTAMRRGYSWYLVSRLDMTGDLSSLDPGTLRLRAASTVMFEGVGGDIAGHAWGGTTFDRFLDSASGFASVVLSRDPAGSVPIIPYLNGLAVMPHLWTYDAITRTLSFYTTIGEIGNLVVEYQTWSPNYDDEASIAGRGFISAVEEFIPA